ncbi:MAG TPA: nucleotide sugar dehydrogenase [Nitrospirota bacterium]|nr:nucleotide sugar dehydrogenase [Nitrospirota bacterium]
MREFVSLSPEGVQYPLPRKDDYAAEFKRVEALSAAARKNGQEIVVVIGVGFVGAVMAAIVADSADKDGKPRKFVIGMQRPSVRSYWKIPMLNQGLSPIKAEDPEVVPLINRCVKEKKTLTATYTYDVLTLADVVVIDVQCNYTKNELGNVRNGHVDMGALEEAFEIIANKVNPETLILIETTVAPGTTEQVAFPIMKKIFTRRGIKSDPLLAHSYERVMPGKEYVSSIRDFWRVCSGVNELAKQKVVKFLNEIINTTKYPLTVLDRPVESETAKIVENSYRAAILAFMDEWSLFAERNGVDIIKVINAIRTRPTHSNLMFPGPGIGGYCLPKDGALGIWAYKHILGFEDDIFRITPRAIDINDTRPLHSAQLVRDALRNMNVPIAGAEILILGASYREDVGDTRYSGSEILVRKLAEMGAEIRVHDPYVDHWWEFKNQEVYPDSSKRVFFRNQKKLKELEVNKDIRGCLNGIDALVFAVKHKEYIVFNPDEIVRLAGKPIAVIDCFGILDDQKIRRYLELGCEVKGMGRGHIRRIKESLKEKGRIEE